MGEIPHGACADSPQRMRCDSPSRACADPQPRRPPLARAGPRVAGRTVRVAGLAAALCVLAVGAGCGESIELPDLFVVHRSGHVPGASLTVLVNEGGAVHCAAGSFDPAHPGPARQLSDAQLIRARAIAEELQSPSARHLSLSPRPGSVFRYYVRDAEGWVRFADNSPGQPPVEGHLALWVLEVAQRVCHLPE